MNKKNKKIECDCCKDFFDEDEISYPDKKSPYKDKALCQECLWGILNGNIVLENL